LTFEKEGLIMKRWVIVAAAMFAMSVVVSGIVGCGAKPPTTSEYDESSQQDTKTVVNLEIIEDDGRDILVD
jgi:hypothetical protein